MTINALIWDLDDTIYKQPDGFYQSCYQQAAHSVIQHGYNGTVESAIENASLSYKKYGYSIQYFYQDCGLSQKNIEMTYAGLVAQLVKPCSQTNEFIRNFKGPQIVVSHSPKPWVDEMLQKLELNDIFPEDYRVTSEIITHHGKTISHEPFVKAGLKLGHAPENIAVFEDFADNLRNAKLAGMQTILVTNGRQVEQQPFINYYVDRPGDSYKLVA